MKAVTRKIVKPLFIRRHIGAKNTSRFSTSKVFLIKIKVVGTKVVGIQEHFTSDYQTEN